MKTFNLDSASQIAKQKGGMFVACSSSSPASSRLHQRRITRGPERLIICRLGFTAITAKPRPVVQHVVGIILLLRSDVYMGG
ncbi:hypothetical protein IF1G_09732 [Cordyceps javanica]|uniref:Uncharacterized protein n=1 Tax=Cordyceps javanica TaxID=43265 RepID=A0A545UQC1_9HYPO|nr:hypothetical protein IF1G_09732 [Cordyceps javanica]